MAEGNDVDEPQLFLSELEAILNVMVDEMGAGEDTNSDSDSDNDNDNNDNDSDNDSDRDSDTCSDDSDSDSPLERERERERWSMCWEAMSFLRPDGCTKKWRLIIDKLSENY